MRINNNLGAMNTYSKLTSTNSLKEKSLEKLSSGLRINRAADDAAGLAISEKMRAQIKGLNQAGRNAQDGVSLIQTAEGGLSETHSMLQRMRELSVQASNGTLSAEDKTNIQTEIDELVTEVGKVASNTKFNGTTLLSGTFGVADAGTGTANAVTNIKLSIDGTEAATYNITEDGAGAITITNSTTNEAQTIDNASTTLAEGNSLNFDALGIKIAASGGDLTTTDLAGKTFITSGTGADIQVGANNGDTMGINIGNMTAAGLGISAIDVTSDATGAIATLDTAISTVSSERAKLGAYQNRLEHTMNNLTTSAENLTSAESRIRDVDMAKEMMNFTKNNILSQAATSMLAQANQSSQGVLQLLR